MELFLGVFAAAALALHVAGSLDAWLGARRIARLDRVSPRREVAPPGVSIVVAARDEAATIEAGLASLLAQDHAQLEVIVVDDRSVDGTGAVVERLGARDPRVRRIRIDELPAGWLGKNHALARGAAAATQPYVLFTDADIVFAPGTVGRALAHARERGVDHLTAAPGIVAPTWPLALLVSTFAVLFARFTKPWRAADPNSPAYIGIGAFNLVRRAAYEEAGGHAAIRLRVDDDLRLGELLKRRGFRQEFVFGRGALEVEWYPDLGAMVRGLEKGAFAGLDYRLSLVALLAVALLGLFVAPFVLLAWMLVTGTGQPVTMVLLALSCATVVVGQAWAARDAEVAVWPALLAPVGALVFLFTLVRSAVVTLRRGGVVWRGTHYPLAMLRAAAREPA